MSFHVSYRVCSCHSLPATSWACCWTLWAQLLQPEFLPDVGIHQQSPSACFDHRIET